MSTWATKRQFAYAGILILIFILGLAFVGVKIFYTPPSCFDGKKNGLEEGVDCGGACAKLCEMETVPPIILWQRISQVSPGLYNALAYIENSNPNAIAMDLPYLFKLYDTNGIVVGEREGVTYLPANTISPVFEGAINTGQRTASTMTFEFTQKPVWKKQTINLPKLTITSQTLSQEDTLPRLDATVMNASIQTVAHADVIAILYDGKGNAVAFAKSAVDNLAKNASQSIVFTWRQPFGVEISKIEIVPRIPF